MGVFGGMGKNRSGLEFSNTPFGYPVPAVGNEDRFDLLGDLEWDGHPDAGRDVDPLHIVSGRHARESADPYGLHLARLQSRYLHDMPGLQESLVRFESEDSSELGSPALVDPPIEGAVRDAGDTSGIVITARRQRHRTPAQWRVVEAQQAAAIRAEEQGAIPVAASRRERIDGTRQQVFVTGEEAGPDVEATGDYIPKDNPGLAGVRDHYRAMLKANRPYHEVRRFLRGHGIVNADTLTSVRQQLNFRRLHPDVPISAYPTGELDDMWVEVEPHRAEARKQKEEMARFQNKPGAEEVVSQGVTMGMRDEAGGVGNVLRNAMTSPFTAETFDPFRAYSIGKQIEMMRLEEARENLGRVALPLEIGSSLFAANPRALGAIKEPLSRVVAAMKQGATGGFISGYGYGDGSVDSARGAISGLVLGASLAAGAGIVPRLPTIMAKRNLRREALRPRNYPAGSLLARREAFLDGYDNGKGHHFVGQAKFRDKKPRVSPIFHPVMDWYMDSKFNVLRSETRRKTRVDHHLNDESFHAARMPKTLGGPWLASELDLDKHDALERVIFGSPPALKVAVGVPVAAANGAAAWYLLDEHGKPHSSEPLD